MPEPKQNDRPEMLAALTVDEFVALLRVHLPQPDEVLTTAEAAAYLKLHPDYVSDLAKRGKLPANKCGREWRFMRSDLIAYVRRQ